MNITREHPVRVVAISGSLRDTSYTRMALDVTLRGAAEAGAVTEMIDLRDYELPFFKKDRPALPPDVARLRADVKRADGIILGTPEYHGSVSGVLKNALDLMGFEEFEGKMIGLVGVSGGALGATEALNTLRTIGRSLHAWVLPQQVSVPEVWKVFDASGAMSSRALEGRLLELGRQVARFAFLHAAERAGDFLQLWETAPPNPGGEH
ncbi:MAG TPA: NAD(P)H-dependent oxidoreductase [Roseiflexaceae bacterium]|nr:NAD(P)H-dependent oxidoreductase [Roseiflexaceae bacterium]